jgi:hypothetical protein
MRTSPNTHSSIVASLKNGIAVGIYERKGQWAFAESFADLYPGTGWFYSPYLTDCKPINQDASAEPPTTATPSAHAEVSLPAEVLSHVEETRTSCQEFNSSLPPKDAGITRFTLGGSPALVNDLKICGRVGRQDLHQAQDPR